MQQNSEIISDHGNQDALFFNDNRVIETELRTGPFLFQRDANQD